MLDHPRLDVLMRLLRLLQSSDTGEEGKEAGMNRGTAPLLESFGLFHDLPLFVKDQLLVRVCDLPGTASEDKVETWQALEREPAEDGDVIYRCWAWQRRHLLRMWRQRFG